MPDDDRGHGGGAPVPMLLDTDIGNDVDDALALVLAARDPRIDLVGVTTVNGDAAGRAAIAGGLLRLLGRDDVPVGVGAEVGLSGTPHASMPAPVDLDVGPLRLAGGPFPPAAEVLAGGLRGTDQPVQVCVVGAATNVAAVLAAEPALCERVRRVDVMGGCFGPVHMGDDDRTPASPFSEFNLGCDPLAAAVLAALPVPLRFVPIDVTMPIFLEPGDRTAIRAAGALGAALDHLADRWVEAQQASRGRPPALAQVRLHDPLTVLAAVDPRVAVVEVGRVAVAGGPGRVVTFEHPSGRVAEIVRRADPDLLRRALVEVVRGAGPAAG